MNMTGLFAGALITDFLGKMTEEGHVSECFVILALIMLFTLILQFFALRPRTDNAMA